MRTIEFKSWMEEFGIVNMDGVCIHALVDQNAGFIHFATADSNLFSMVDINRLIARVGKSARFEDFDLVLIDNAALA